MGQSLVKSTTTWRTNRTLPDQVTNAAASRRICRWQADASTPSWSLLHGSLPPQFTSTPCSATALLLTEPSFDGSSTTYISGRLDAYASLNWPRRHFAVSEPPGLTATAILNATASTKWSAMKKRKKDLLQEFDILDVFAEQNRTNLREVLKIKQIRRELEEIWRKE